MKYLQRSVFISYNHQTTSDIAGRIYDRLSHRLGPGVVFKDNEEPELGVDFRDSFKAALSECRVMLVVIDPGWYERRNAHPLGEDVPPDWVRMEVEYGLQKEGMRVIPLLVNNAPSPETQPLPPTLASLRLRYSKRIHSDDGFKSSMDGLVDDLEKRLGRPSKFSAKMLTAGAIAALVLAAGATVYATQAKWTGCLHFGSSADPSWDLKPEDTKLQFLTAEGNAITESTVIPAIRRNDLDTQKNGKTGVGLEFSLKFKNIGETNIQKLLIHVYAHVRGSADEPVTKDHGMYISPTFGYELRPLAGGYNLEVGNFDVDLNTASLKPQEQTPTGWRLYVNLGANGQIMPGEHKLGIEAYDGNKLVCRSRFKVNVE